MLQTRVIIILLIVLNIFHETTAYIFDVNYSYKYSTKKTVYSSVFLQQNKKDFRFLAGAPKTDNILICNTTVCKSFAFSSQNEAGFEMLGAAIAAGNTVGDPTYICAPHYIVLPSFRINGRCFALHENFKPIYSLDNRLQQVKAYNGSYEFYYAQGQVGFSAKYVEDNEFLLGAPGVLSWKGTVIKHTDLNIKNILQPEKVAEKNSYLGYAIEFGEYYFGGRKRRCAIGGAPRGDNLLGQVSLI
ncbi:hypothetical protein QE152_g33933 [Popillia japonica]|uniref:Uncharacterized protein n=1 Tax=Popillia japonica TaxID=7064 RepID=A0AAW1IV54_POPJA